MGPRRTTNIKRNSPRKWYREWCNRNMDHQDSSISLRLGGCKVIDQSKCNIYKISKKSAKAAKLDSVLGGGSLWFCETVCCVYAFHTAIRISLYIPKSNILILLASWSDPQWPYWPNRGWSLEWPVHNVCAACTVIWGMRWHHHRVTACSFIAATWLTWECLRKNEGNRNFALYYTTLYAVDSMSTLSHVYQCFCGLGKRRSESKQDTLEHVY